MKTVIAIIAIVAVLGGGYALVQNSDSNKESSTPATSTSTTKSHEDMNMNSSQSSASSSSAEATSKVEIMNFAFSPANITVKKGTTVTWTNSDSTSHDVTETDGKDGPKSKLFAKGETFSFTYNTVGTFAYNCSIHPQMTGKVTVTE